MIKPVAPIVHIGDRRPRAYEGFSYAKKQSKVNNSTNTKGKYTAHSLHPQSKEIDIYV